MSRLSLRQCRWACAVRIICGAICQRAFDVWASETDRVKQAQLQTIRLPLAQRYAEAEGLAGRVPVTLHKRGQSEILRSHLDSKGKF
jgi:hypothetical protein